MTKIERESINFKLPKPLTAALRAKARELDTTATDLVIQGLHHVLSKAYDHVDTCAEDHYTRIEAMSALLTDSGIETRLHQLSTQLNYLESRIDRRVENGVEDGSKQRLEALEQKLEAFSLRLAQTEGAIALLGQRQQTSPRRQAFNYHPPQVELQPFNEENLAKRLAASASTIRNEREPKVPKNLSPGVASVTQVGWRGVMTREINFIIR